MSIVSTTDGIVSEIALRLNEVSADNRDRYVGYINQGVRDVYADMPMAPNLQTSAYRTLSAGTRLYANVASDHSKMNGVRDPTGTLKLKYLHPEQFDLLHPSANDGSGHPIIYTIRGQGPTAQVEFSPTPDAAYDIVYDYQALPGQVSTASSVPPLPQTYMELPILFGEKMGLRRRGLRAEAQQIDIEYQALKSKFIADMLDRVTENQTILQQRDLIAAGRGTTNDPGVNIFWNS